MPSFLIADDHSVVRMGAILMIREVFPHADIAEAETFDEAIKKLEKQSFDMLLLDIHIPGGDTIHMIPAVRLRQQQTAILIFSSYSESLYAPEYLKAGADGYLAKNAPPEEFKGAIQKIFRGKKYISDVLQDRLVNELLKPKNAPVGETVPLSQRETEVMHLLIKGASAKEIKQALSIHDSTISTYKTRIFEKLQVTNVIELAEKIRMSGPVYKNSSLHQGEKTHTAPVPEG
ncbi:response regulator transcription factor [Chitinophaga qingshengii]|uniref:Response regulator transcription factor n=1 Tax=Chitinophaga qingshengii TaxID=1569794 RepID=A0ABR7TPX9_9BACT|nr:response regulator transcription factor [Chitinophaga qingshengii]MBC9932527.1 response regulator transcription factor [Chitinophaga qingshengii]